MAILDYVKMYAAGLVACFVLDLLWLGVVARQFYQQQLGHLMRPDVQWIPAVLFYLIYVAALVVFVAGPAAEKQSVTRAVMFGAFFGIAAYSAFDLTSLALLKDFPLKAALVDLTWGAVLSALVSGAATAVARGR